MECPRVRVFEWFWILFWSNKWYFILKNGDYEEMWSLNGALDCLVQLFYSKLGNDITCVKLSSSMSGHDWNVSDGGCGCAQESDAETQYIKVGK